jgi:hypothetical protein
MAAILTAAILTFETVRATCQQIGGGQMFKHLVGAWCSAVPVARFSARHQLSKTPREFFLAIDGSDDV